MKFSVKCGFEATPERVMQAWLSPGFLDFVASQQTDLRGLSLQRETRQDGIWTRQIHYRPQPAFERLGPRKIPPSWFEFVEHSRCDMHARRATFENVFCKDKVARRLKSHGSVRFQPNGQQGCLYRVDAELQLHELPLWLRPLSGMAERRLCRSAQALLQSQSALLARWLDGDR